MKSTTSLTLARAIRISLLCFTLFAGFMVSRAATPIELIPRKLLFGNPTRSSPQLSPDGAMLSFLAPRDGVMNIWVSPTGKFESAKPLTAEKNRPLQNYTWARNGEDLLYIQDSGGDENFLLYAVNVHTGTIRKLTDFSKTRVVMYGLSWTRPDELIIGLNHRDPRWHDAWLLNLRTGELSLLHENTQQLSGYTADGDLNLRFASRSRPDGGWELLKFTPDDLEVMSRIEYEDSDTTFMGGLTQDGRTLYLLDSRGRDKSVLKSITLATGEEEILAENARADIGGAMPHPVTGRMLAYRVAYLRSEWLPLDSSLTEDFAYLTANVKGEWNPASRTKDNRFWIIVRNDPTIPGAFLLYNRTEKSLTPLFTSRPELEDKPLAPMHAMELKARDGLTLVSYLTLPPGTDSDGDGRPDQPVPLVLLVHGGPWWRDGYGFHPTHQWLANRGYAVLSVNFRGSTGFGKRFIRAGDQEWAGRMHDDLLDAVDWAIAERISPRDKIAIMGGSYGGYATLVGLTFTPDVFACGVDIVGPSNLETLLSTFPPYWEAARAKFARAVGDSANEEGRKLLRDRSPLYRADAIKRPLLIGQGANDPRVKQAESDQIVAAMKERAIPVTYVLYPDEGHGFARPENSLSFNAITEAFLAHTLGGRFEPIGDDFRGSSLKVPEGTRHVAGLDEALAASATRRP